ncbi:MAG TPA: hypothetical protein VGZ04_07340 [Acidimicrobiales bacterium]|jgi:hypothetical protein|nr:hypothetical protein [Acidimicrobiales bacterium]
MSNDLAVAPWFGPLFVLVALVAVAVLAFEILMILNVLRNDKLSATARAWWIVGMLLVHPFVAIAYRLTHYEKPRRGVLKV